MRCKTRVPIAYSKSEVSGASKGGTYSKSEMPCNKEDGITEVERAVQVVVVQNNCRREDDPNGDYSRGRDLWLLSWNLGGNGGRQVAVGVLLYRQQLIGWLNELLLFELSVSGLLGGHCCISGREQEER